MTDNYHHSEPKVNNDKPDRTIAKIPVSPSRRSVIKSAALAGMVGMSGVVSGQDVISDGVIELDGETSGWVGVSPEEIEGETNPTLSLTAGEDYTVEWTNVDGAAHNFAINDEEGEEILSTDAVSGEGETQTIEFTATEEMAEYVCQPHPDLMAGQISTGNDEHSPDPEPGPSSPDLEKYAQSLPLPDIRDPDENANNGGNPRPPAHAGEQGPPDHAGEQGPPDHANSQKPATQSDADYYDVPITEFTQSLHPDLPDTTLWGYDEVYPGPIIKAQRDQPVNVRFDNSDLPEEHIFTVDDIVDGTDPEDYPDHHSVSEVPEVRTSTHLHGLNIEPESDGQSMAWTSPSGVSGPMPGKEVQEVPNHQSRLTGVYHDHALGITRLNVYAGLVGFYFIESEEEEQLDLPSGEYDIPLLLQDKTFNEDGSLYYPDSFVSEFAGDTAVVNGAVWPYFEVEPRRYRFRMVNGSNGRAFNLRFEHESGEEAPTMYQIAPDQGFLESVVPIGSDETLDSLLLTTFERADIIVDFSDYAGETFTVTNDAEWPYMGQNSGSDLSELLQIRVTDPDEDPEDTSTHPENLNLPGFEGFDEDDVVETRHMTMDMTTEDGVALNLLNNSRMFDEDAVVKPQLGTTEVWELENRTGHTHPIHLHLVGFEVLGRGPDGTEEPDPNERGEKDVVRVDPDETVRIITKFGDFAGRYPWHCHVLEHEDHDMMLPFEVVSEDSDSS
jgi:laccase